MGRKTQEVTLPSSCGCDVDFEKDGVDMGVSENRGTPKSSILIRFSIINHPFGGTTILGNTYMCLC